jgi:hypothetical protein
MIKIFIALLMYPMLVMAMIGGIDANVSVDTEYITDPSKIVQDVKDVANVGQNIIQAGQRTGDAASDLANAVGKNGLNVGKTVDTYRDKTAHREAQSRLTPAQVDVLANPQNYSISERKAVANEYNNTYAELRKIDSNEANFYDEIDEDKAIDDKGLDKRKMTALTDGDNGSNASFYHADKTTEKGTFIQALGHEAKRQDQIAKGVKNQTPDGISTVHDKEAFEAGQHAKKALASEMKYKGVKYDDTAQNRHEYTQSDRSLLRVGNQGVKQVSDAQPLLESAWDAANVGMGVHSAAKNIKDGNYKSAAVDAAGVALDTIGLATPFVPSGAGAAIKANRLSKKAKTLKQNRINGAKREKIVQAELEKEYGKGNVLQQRTILNSAGKKAIDQKTGTGRRLDHVVLDKKGNAILRVETTSKTAPKSKQLRKERDIIAGQETYVRHPKTKEFIPIKKTKLKVKRKD